MISFFFCSSNVAIQIFSARATEKCAGNPISCEVSSRINSCALMMPLFITVLLVSSPRIAKSLFSTLYPIEIFGGSSFLRSGLIVKLCSFEIVMANLFLFLRTYQTKSLSMNDIILLLWYS